MPVYHNYLTKGQKWRELGVTKDKVLVRCEQIKRGSTKLYEYICFLINDAVQKDICLRNERYLFKKEHL